MIEMIKPALYGLPAAAAVAALVLLVACLPGRRRESDRARAWGPALALGLGYLAGQGVISWVSAGADRAAWAALVGRLQDPFGDVEYRILHVALLATALGALDATWRTPAWACWENRLLASALTLALVLGPMLLTWEAADGGGWIVRSRVAGAPPWEKGSGARWLAVAAAVVVLSWANLEALAARFPGPRLALPLTVLAFGAAATLLAAHSLTYAMLAGALAAALAATWLVALAGPRLTFARGGAVVVALVLSALVIEGGVYADLPGRSALLLAASPLALWAGQLGPVRRLRPWQATLVGTVAVLIPVAAALALAASAAPPPMDS